MQVLHIFEIANWKYFTRSITVFHRLSKSVMCMNRFGWLCHFERVVRCLEPGNNALHSVCVVMLCYGFVLLCLSSPSFEEWTSLTERREIFSLSLSLSGLQSIILPTKLGHSMISHLLLSQQDAACFYVHLFITYSHRFALLLNVFLLYIYHILTDSIAFKLKCSICSIREEKPGLLSS